MIDVLVALGLLGAAVAVWQASGHRRDRRRRGSWDWAVRDRQPRRTSLTTTRTSPEEDR